MKVNMSTKTKAGDCQKPQASLSEVRGDGPPATSRPKAQDRNNDDYYHRSCYNSSLHFNSPLQYEQNHRRRVERTGSVQAAVEMLEEAHSS